ncbi:FAD-dependent monooxygenase [Blastopirellula sp. J2-11]|uniref:FAD-dependent monooxygenase n=1 Tax=Blastopirellula sp. J2-11 TaxID=2943192 RepID=UPI0021C7735E|nr:FAD-dependent monooxygenase [Blastopirellula sp. J2-11]UUO06150.1 FAD-dependent monooxygenase [Blastopirellula sp. J2-11]
MQVAILGGGVAGLASAIALKQLGMDVVVYERRAEIANLGAGIVCWPNACFVLSEFGLLDEVRSCSQSIFAMRRVSQQGEALGTLDVRLLSEQMQYPSRAILRADLMRILQRQAMELEIPIRFEHAVVEISTAADDLISVRFDNGLQIQADLVLGAEGRMKSIARQFVLGENRPNYQRFVNWLGIYEGPISSDAQTSVSDFWGVGARFGFVPVAADKAYWAGGLAVPSVTTSGGIDPWEEVATLFADWPDPIPQWIAASDQASIRKIFVHDLDPINQWSRDAVLLIGDAAHAALPTSGQGACQALEDAWHLAKAIERNAASISAALDDFCERRIGKTQNITMAARGLADSLFHCDAQACRERNRRSQQSDYRSVALGIAEFWSEGLPIGVAPSSSPAP